MHLQKKKSIFLKKKIKYKKTQKIKKNEGEKEEKIWHYLINM